MLTRTFFRERHYRVKRFHSSLTFCALVLANIISVIREHVLSRKVSSSELSSLFIPFRRIAIAFYLQPTNLHRYAPFQKNIISLSPVHFVYLFTSSCKGKVNPANSIKIAKDGSRKPVNRRRNESDDPAVEQDGCSVHQVISRSDVYPGNTLSNGSNADGVRLDGI